MPKPLGKKVTYFEQTDCSSGHSIQDRQLGEEIRQGGYTGIPAAYTLLHPLIIFIDDVYYCDTLWLFDVRYIRV
jgi:hypothetical protein